MFMVTVMVILWGVLVRGDRVVVTGTATAVIKVRDMFIEEKQGAIILLLS
jgi:hypothetical protein